jgi:rod shape determining protein RodA
MLLIVLVSSYLFLGLGAKQKRLPISFVTLLALFCLSVFNFLQYGYLLLLVVLSGFYFYFIAFRAGKYREILIALSLTISSIALSFGTQWAFDNVLKPHQRARINVWLKPQLSDPKGELYNIIQSKTAIGSGGFSGKGFLNGTMTKLNYVPEQNTDFVFSILGEEQGFIGSISLIFLFTIMLFRISHIAERSNFLYIKYFSYAIAGIFFLHFFINIGMTMGIMPVIGIPLPLISKGGSSFLSFTIMIAMILKMDLARSRQ